MCDDACARPDLARDDVVTMSNDETELPGAERDQAGIAQICSGLLSTHYILLLCNVSPIIVLVAKSVAVSSSSEQVKYFQTNLVHHCCIHHRRLS